MENSRDMFDLFNERERNEIQFARIYSEDFRHGTDGHTRILLVAKLANIIEMMCEFISEEDFAELLTAREELDNA